MAASAAERLVRLESAPSPIAAPGFAGDLLDFAAAARDGARLATFDLPRLRLEVATDHPAYAALCRATIVDWPALAGPSPRVLHVSVLDHATRPAMPVLRPPLSVRTPQQLSDLLNGLDREGSYDAGYRSWQIFDRQDWMGVETLLSPGHYAPWVESFPLRNFLHWAYLTTGWRLVHAGTLGLDGKGVMLVGASGAGKSGTTLAGILGGLDSVGDDYVAFDISDGRTTAHPVMRLMKQDAAGLARLGVDPATLGVAAPNWQGKYEFDFEGLGRGRRPPSFELQAIVMPRIAHAARSTFTRAPSRTAMLAFAPSNLQQLPGGWRDTMAFTAEVARRLPAYFMDLGTDRLEIADALAAFIAGGSR